LIGRKQYVWRKKKDGFSERYWSVYIKENKERCMNLNEGIGVNTIYMEEERIFGQGGKTRNLKKKRGRNVFKIMFIVNYV
jgi:hypothetical protein